MVEGAAIGVAAVVITDIVAITIITVDMAADTIVEEAMTINRIQSPTKEKEAPSVNQPSLRQNMTYYMLEQSYK
jgi:hypothetical protein